MDVVQAVIYGLPLVLMDITLRKMTNVSPGRHLARPVNQLAHLRAFPTAAFKDVVRANVDTLYSSAFLDLAKEPMVLSVPDTRGRYYLLPMLDAWSNVFATPGSRTTGNQRRHLCYHRTELARAGAAGNAAAEIAHPYGVDPRPHTDQRA